MKHNLSRTLRRSLADLRNSIDEKEILSILLLEAGTLLMMGRYGNLAEFYPITIMLVVFTLIMCVVSFWFKANVPILISVIALTNIGFIIQTIHPPKEIKYYEFAQKCAVALAALCIAFLLFPWFAHILSDFWVVAALMVLQYSVIVFMRITNTKIEGVTWLELVKAIHVLVMPGLFCGNQFDREVSYIKLRLGTLILLIHTVILTIGFVVLSEMGTLLVMWAVFLASGWIFCNA